MKLRLEATYPFMEAEDVFNLLGDLKTRMKVDDRFESAEILDEKDDCIVFYHKSKKPPIPMVSAREMLYAHYKQQDGMGEGKHFICSQSVEHPSKPIKTGLTDDVRAKIKFGGAVFFENPDGAGTKTLEFRDFDFGGNIPGPAIAKMSDGMPVKSFQNNTGLIKKRLEGDI